MITIRDLHKSFDGREALDGINMTIEAGSIYGLVGTNGAGKTTIIKHMAGVLRPDAGEISYDGSPVYENPEVKQRIGYIPDELFFPVSYTLNDMGRQYSSMYRAWDEERFEELTGIFRLDRAMQLRSMSKGMKKQAMFALVLACTPDYLLLDEPMDGLDPIVRRIVWKQIVDDVADREMHVLVSSHNLRDLETICDHVGIISKGRTVIEKDLDSVREGVNKVQVAFRPEDRDKAEEIMSRLNILRRDKNGSVELLIVGNDAAAIDGALGIADPLILDILPLSLEEVFIYELGGDNYDFSEIL